MVASWGAFLVDHLPELGLRTLQHLMLTGVSTGLAILIGVPLGIIAFRVRRARGPIVSTTGIPPDDSQPGHAHAPLGTVAQDWLFAGHHCANCLRALADRSQHVGQYGRCLPRGHGSGARHRHEQLAATLARPLALGLARDYRRCAHRCRRGRGDRDALGFCRGRWIGAIHQPRAGISPTRA